MEPMTLYYDTVSAAAWAAATSEALAVALMADYLKFEAICALASCLMCIPTPFHISVELCVVNLLLIILLIIHSNAVSLEPSAHDTITPKLMVYLLGAYHCFCFSSLEGLTCTGGMTIKLHTLAWNGRTQIICELSTAEV
jgi:hypothetical protein